MDRSLTRETVLHHFLLQQSHFSSVASVRFATRGLALALDYQGRHLRAVVLVKSSDYWEYRLHLASNRPGLIVCHRHDSLVPLPVLSLEDGREYQAEDLPKKYEQLAQARDEHSRHAAKVLLGALLCGVKEAHDLLLAMPESTRRKYELKMHTYQRRQRGRPLAS